MIHNRDLKFNTRNIKEEKAKYKYKPESNNTDYEKTMKLAKGNDGAVKQLK